MTASPRTRINDKNLDGEQCITVNLVRGTGTTIEVKSGVAPQ